MYHEVLSEFLGRPLTAKEARLMAEDLKFFDDGLSDELLATAQELADSIQHRTHELREMGSREQYRHEEPIRRLLNAMEGFYLFGGTVRVRERGIRATHPWGAVISLAGHAYEELEEIHAPLLARAMYERQVGNLQEAAAEARWSKLKPVKALAFDRRKELAGVSRAEAIRRMLPEILEAARAAGVPLTGQAPEDTVAKWFRDAGIK